MKFSLIMRILLYFSIVTACNNPSNQLVEDYFKKMEIEINDGNKYIILQTQYCKPCQKELLTNMTDNRKCFDDYQIIIVKSNKLINDNFNDLFKEFNIIIDEKSEFNKLKINPFENTIITHTNGDYNIQIFDENSISNLCN